MKENSDRRVEGSERESHPQQSPEAALSRAVKAVVIDEGLHRVLKARAAREGRRLQVLVEARLRETLEPAEIAELGEAVPA